MFVLAASMAAAADVEPKVSEATYSKIRDLQLAQESIKSQYLQLQVQMDNVKGQYDAKGAEIAKALDEAYKEASAKPEEWSLSPQTLKFTKIEKPKLPEGVPPIPAKEKKP
jgi:hypothetical protein